MKAVFCLLFVFCGTIFARSGILEIAFMNMVSPFEVVHNEEESLENPVTDFFLGIYDGIMRGYRSDLALVNTCVKSLPKIWARWVAFYDYLRNLTWETFRFNVFIQRLMDTIMGSIGQGIPCIIIAMMLDKFVELILNPTLEQLKMTLIKSLAQNAQFILNTIIDIFRCLFAFAWYGIGSDIGLVFYVILVH